MVTTAQERFVFPRHRARIILLFKHGDSWQPVFTKDLSGTGALVELMPLPAIDSTFHCMLSEHGIFECTVRVARHLDEGVGIEFVDPSSAFSAAVSRIIMGVEDS